MLDRSISHPQHCSFVVAVFVLAAAVPSHGEELTASQIDRLKATYLDCERCAVAGSIGSAEIGRCSIVYEELKRLVFDGEFARLRDWFEAQKELSELSS